MKKCFLFYQKSSFRFRDFKFCTFHFPYFLKHPKVFNIISCPKRDSKTQLDQYLERERRYDIKFSQMIKYYIKKIFI